MTGHGPLPNGAKFMRTNVRYMSRRDLFVSARQFLLVGVLCAVASVTTFVLIFADSSREGPNVYLLGVSLVLAILAAVGLLGGVYLADRATLRSPAYDPEQVRKADLEAAFRRSRQSGSVGVGADSSVGDSNPMIARLLRAVADGSMSAYAAIAELRPRLTELVVGTRLVDAWSLLQRLAQESDILAKDSSYEKSLRAKLDCLAREIESGPLPVSRSRATRVTKERRLALRPLAKALVKERIAVLATLSNEELRAIQSHGEDITLDGIQVNCWTFSDTRGDDSPEASHHAGCQVEVEDLKLGVFIVRWTLAADGYRLDGEKRCPMEEEDWW